MCPCTLTTLILNYGREQIARNDYPHYTQINNSKNTAPNYKHRLNAHIKKTSIRNDNINLIQDFVMTKENKVFRLPK